MSFPPCAPALEKHLAIPSEAERTHRAPRSFFGASAFPASLTEQARHLLDQENNKSERLPANAEAEVDIALPAIRKRKMSAPLKMALNDSNSAAPPVTLNPPSGRVEVFSQTLTNDESSSMSMEKASHEAASDCQKRMPPAVFSKGRLLVPTISGCSSTEETALDADSHIPKKPYALSSKAGLVAPTLGTPRDCWVCPSSHQVPKPAADDGRTQLVIPRKRSTFDITQAGAGTQLEDMYKPQTRPELDPNALVLHLPASKEEGACVAVDQWLSDKLRPHQREGGKE